LMVDLRSIPYKRDDWGIGCNSMEVIEKYGGILEDVVLDCGG
jgi:hypothetical protein